MSKIEESIYNSVNKYGINLNEDLGNRIRSRNNIKEEYSLVGQDGNAFSLMGYTARCMKECGLRDEIDEMRRRATSGDYNNLIMVCDEYIQRCNEIVGYDDDDFWGIDESCSKKPRKKVKESIEDYDEFYIPVDTSSATPFKDMLFTAMEDGDAKTVGRELVSFISEDDAEYVCKILGFVE